LSLVISYTLLDFVIVACTVLTEWQFAVWRPDRQGKAMATFGILGRGAWPLASPPKSAYAPHTFCPIDRSAPRVSRFSHADWECRDNFCNLR